MAVKAFKVDGNYPAYLSGAPTATLTGDWIRVPGGARGVTFLYTMTDVASPVGTIGVDVHFGADPTDGNEVAVPLSGTTALDGAGTKKDYMRVSFDEPEIGRPQFVRAKYTRTGGGDPTDVFAVDGTID